MSSNNIELFIVAHPDDETIFCSGLIQSSRAKKILVVATDANADGAGAYRMRQLRAACSAHRISEIICLNQSDHFSKRLNVALMIQNLSQIASALPKKKYTVYTHGALGEYGHIHHQDVAFAAYSACSESANSIFSFAYNLQPDFLLNLSAKQYRRKCEILTKIYGSESTRFLGLLPCSFSEGFVKLRSEEVRHIYEFIRYRKKLSTQKLRSYRWLANYIRKREFSLESRPF